MKLTKGIKKVITATTLLLVGSLVFVIGCQKKREWPFAEAQRLVLDAEADSARLLLDSIDREMSGHDSHREVLRLLENASLVQMGDSIVPPVVFAEAAERLEQRGDNANAAFARYYEGYILYRLLRLKNAAKALKKAEALSNGRDTEMLKYHISKTLFYINHYYGSSEEAFLNAKRARVMADKSGDIRKIVHSSYFLTACLLEKENYKAAMDTVTTLLKYEKEMGPKALVKLYNNVGYTMLLNGLTEPAEKYIRNALAIEPNNAAYANLANIYSKRGMRAESDSLWQIAVKASDVSLRQEALTALFETRYAGGEYERACLAAKELLSEKDSMMSRMEQDNVYAEQLKTEYDIAKETEANRFRVLIALVVIMGLVVALMFIYHRYKQMRMRADIANGQLTADALQKRLEELEKSAQTEAKERDYEIKRLNAKIIEIKKNQSDLYASGKNRYEEIQAGGNIGLWSRKDISDFNDYYSLIDLPFTSGLDTMYSGLTGKNRMFLILAHMGYSDADVQRIFCVGPNAVRTIRSRIKAKLL